MLKFDPHQVKLYQPAKNSHKGQNGKLLVIGGSKLFHSSIFWSADVASRIVDLVHLTSPANENNQIFRSRLKEKFWNGIVVDWKDVESYIEEDDCILIGPGMIRSEEMTIEDRKWRVGAEDRRSKIEKADLSSTFHPLPPSSILHHLSSSELDRWGQQDKTREIVNYLLAKFPAKRWVIDGGALQEVDVKLITECCILTPHRRELNILMEKFSIFNYQFSMNLQLDNLTIEDQAKLIAKTLGCAILLKGVEDIVCSGEERVRIVGGNPGMTKGGTGDVLAGLAAALYAKNDIWTAAAMASYINKKAGESLYNRVGPYFNAEDLVKEVPLTIYGIMGADV
jgi:NAD(P)H-hydrate epimerase